MAGVLASLDAQIAALEAEITRKERWELRNEEREDVLAEEGTFEKAMGAVEVKKVYMLVGAESERTQLAELLARRAKFIGSEPLVDEEEETTAEGGKKPSSRSKVVGFGREYAELYGLGGKFDETAEVDAENARFAKGAVESAVPAAVRAHKGNKTWATGGAIVEEDAAVLERKAQRVKRNRLAYSGISA
jgi:hypothetical protein